MSDVDDPKELPRAVPQRRHGDLEIASQPIVMPFPRLRPPFGQSALKESLLLRPGVVAEHFEKGNPGELVHDDSEPLRHGPIAPQAFLLRVENRDQIGTAVKSDLPFGRQLLHDLAMAAGPAMLDG